MKPRHSISNVDHEAKTAICSICGHTRVHLRKGYSPQCMTVRKATRNPETPEARKHRAWRNKYGIEADAVEQLFAEQNGLCVICTDGLTSFHVDHDHSTGVVRGLLCRGCNMGLGHFRDDPEALLRASKYLQK